MLFANVISFFCKCIFVRFVSQILWKITKLSEADIQETVDYREFVRAAMRATNLDATKLARRAGLSPSTVTRVLNREDNPTMHANSVEAISRVSGVPAPFPPSIWPTKTAPAPAISKVEFQRDVPMRVLIGSSARDLYYLNHLATEFAVRPPGIMNSDRAFALRMPDDSMEGWRRPNEIIYFDPMRAIAEGDHALVEFANASDPNGPGLYTIRRIARRRGAEITLGTWGFEPGEQTVKRTDIVSLTRVVEWQELLGA